MTVPFEVFNDQGRLDFHSDMIAWFCARSGTGATVAAPAPGNTSPSAARIDVSGYTVPLVAVRIEGHTTARAPNTYASGEYIYTSSAPVGTAFTWYIYDYAPRLPALSGPGIETFTPAGDRSFSSAYFPFKAVKDVQGGSIYTPGRLLATCGTNMGGRCIAGPLLYYQSGSGGFSPVPEGSPFTHTGYQNNCKLYGGKIVGPDYVELGLVSFDDVFIGPRLGAPTTPPDWQISSSVLAIDVSDIPIGAVFF